MSSVSGLSAVSQYIISVKDEDTAADNYAKTDATVQNTVASFQKSASSITSAQDLLDNYSALKVVLGAYGLGSIIDETAVLKDLMTQDPTSSTSLAVTSDNSAWQAFAAAFSDWTTSPLADSSTVSSISQDYLTSEYETNENETSSGLGTALYFTREISSVSTLSELMSNSSLLKVVETVNGYDPTQFGALDYDQQVRLLTGKVDFSDFSSSEKIQDYAERYLATLQYNPPSDSETYSLLSLYGASGSDVSILSLFGASSSSSTSSGILSLYS